jgi:hypothetical protein
MLAVESFIVLSLTVESFIALSLAVLSALGAGFVLSPQDAKEIAAIATNIKTNFFIFLCF